MKKERVIRQERQDWNGRNEKGDETIKKGRILRTEGGCMERKKNLKIKF